MTLYDVWCDQCKWKASAPVDERVAAKFRGHRCKNCKAAGRPDRRFTVREHIFVGPTMYLPANKSSVDPRKDQHS